MLETEGKFSSLRKQMETCYLNLQMSFSNLISLKEI
jgi:hypothetical protein